MSSRVETLNEEVTQVYNKLIVSTDSYQLNDQLSVNRFFPKNAAIGPNIVLYDFILESSKTYLLQLYSTYTSNPGVSNYVATGAWRVNVSGAGLVSVTIWNYTTNGSAALTSDFVLSTPANNILRVATSALVTGDYYLSLSLHGLSGAEYVKTYYK